LSKFLVISQAKQIGMPVPGIPCHYICYSRTLFPHPTEEI
jgi:hypothetical protein